MFRRAWPLLLTLLVPAAAQEPAQKGLLRTLPHKKGVADLSFSPDGTTLAVGNFDKLVYIYDVATGEVARPKKLHTGRVTCLAWSPDGRTLATGSDDGSIRFWDAQSLKAAGVIKGAHGRGSHGTGTTSLGYFPDGKSLYSTGYDPRIRIWDAAAHTEIRALERHFDCVVATISADGKRLISTSQDGTAGVWDPATGAHLGELEIEPAIDAPSPHLGYPSVSPDGRRAYAGAGDGKIRSWDVARLERGPAWDAHLGFVGPVEVSREGGLLASGEIHPLGGLGVPDGSWDNAIRLWDAATGEKLLELGGHVMSVARVRFSPDSSLLATASWDGEIRIWDLAALDLLPRAVAGETPDQLWTRLGEDAGPRPWAAARVLVAKPAFALEVLEARLKPAEADPALPEAIARLIRELDDDEPEIRERASDALAQLGPRAAAALEKALESPSAEVRVRAREILRNPRPWTPGSAEERRWQRCIRLLEEIGDAGALACLGRLAGGDSGAVLTGLAAAAKGRVEKGE